MKFQQFFDKEKSNFNIKLINEQNRLNEIEKQIRYENKLLKEENENLNRNFKKLSNDYNILKTSCIVLEQEKSRHLEQNAIDKEEFSFRVGQLTAENQSIRLEMNRLLEMLDIVFKLIK
jgi:hypothetical protein